MKYLATLLLLCPLLSLAATPQDATVAYVQPVVDATHSAATSCTLDRAATSLGVVTPGQSVSNAAPDYGGPYTFGLVCSNSGGASTRITFTATIPQIVLPPNPPTNFSLTFKCSIASGTTVATCTQT